MPLTAKFNNRHTAIFGPAVFALQNNALPLLDELSLAIQDETSQAISGEGTTTVIMLTAQRVGINTFRVSGVLST